MAKWSEPSASAAARVIRTTRWLRREERHFRETSKCIEPYFVFWGALSYIASHQLSPCKNRGRDDAEAAPSLPAAGHGAAEVSGYRFRPCRAQRSIPKPRRVARPRLRL